MDGTLRRSDYVNALRRAEHVDALPTTSSYGYPARFVSGCISGYHPLL